MANYTFNGSSGDERDFQILLTVDTVYEEETVAMILDYLTLNASVFAATKFYEVSENITPEV
jgi:hypothetical protein